ncbi:hypothetical protein OGAPHI_001197 [Ogataea philodendri]|uniref:Uncharacterized protein n=1 Tax=Ogataea philodendri TaxID=1378263 RepID=A0A9P8PER9_9ASCO|nr:uncharacterized protein OGAPHI_001197 [Ogataea philodendri]KAH3670682.1 hypothetical protein OGAPHI_001197 [Ogataea philodendri]
MGRPRIQFSPFKYPNLRKSDSAGTPDLGDSPPSSGTFSVSKAPLKLQGTGPLHAGTPVRKELVADLDDDVRLDGSDSDAGSYNYDEYNSSVMSPVKLPETPPQHEDGLELQRVEEPIVDISSEFEDSEDERGKEKVESLLVEESVKDDVDAEATILRVTDFVEKRRREKAENPSVEPEQAASEQFKIQEHTEPERTEPSESEQSEQLKQSPRPIEPSQPNEPDLSHEWTERWSKKQWAHLSRYLRLYRATKNKKLLAPEKLEREFHCTAEEVYDGIIVIFRAPKLSILVGYVGNVDSNSVTVRQLWDHNTQTSHQVDHKQIDIVIGVVSGD